MPTGSTAQQDASRLLNENSYEYPAGLLGDSTATEIRESDLASAVVSIARTDPVRAADVVRALRDQLPSTEAEAVDTMMVDRLEQARQAEFVLDARPHGAGPSAPADPAQARAEADRLMAASYQRSVVGSLFGAEPQVDPEALADGLVALRAQDPDLAVAARRDLVARLSQQRAEALDAALAEAPHAPGVAMLTAPEGWDNQPVLSSVLGDTAAVVGSAFRDDGLAVNPLSGRILTGRDLQDAQMGAFFDVAGLGLGTAAARAGTTALRHGDELAASTLRQTGARAYYDEADYAHAEAAYEMTRASTTDVAAIAQNTGFKPENVQQIKEHVFHNLHVLDRHVHLGDPARYARFDADPRIADAWQRLTDGTHGAEDLALLRHEMAEAWVERTRGSAYTESHDRAEQSYPAPEWW